MTIYNLVNMDENDDLLFAVCIGLLISFSIVMSSIAIRKLIVYSIQLWKRKPIQISRILDGFFIKTLVLSVISHFFLYLFNEKWNMVVENYLHVIQVNGWMDILVSNPIVLSLLLGCVISLLYCIDSCDVDLVESQSPKINIGAMWAHMAYNSYYEVLFTDWREEIVDYLNSGHRLDCNNLILICPLSCNIDKALDERFSRIEKVTPLPDIECDQAANINRLYKMPVFKVGGEENAFHLIAQFPSSLGTLWQVKDSMPPHKWLYHRESFVTTLRKLLKDCPCTILEYDDTDESSQEPLDSFLISQLNLRNKA